MPAVKFEPPPRQGQPRTLLLEMPGGCGQALGGTLWGVLSSSWSLVLFVGMMLGLEGQCEVFRIGYLTGSSRRPDNREYKRPGLLISGAITMAVKEVNERFPLVMGHRLAFEVAETYGQETESILQTARLWNANISAYIGPQETCVHEARMAASFNLPMISYKFLCSYGALRETLSSGVGRQARAS
ncbi:receptor-type guanylate cyclase Gyc76C-like [Oratosquilla oratoria]|uniref:receptor-type guanylate cyclase Gyc76C-like n=1 Tax=Oratosquilla oratoria TaxID=337810 RepID=UPI003F776098